MYSSRSKNSLNS